MRTTRDFKALLEAQWDLGKFLCIGLDPDFEKLPESVRQPTRRETIVAFNHAIVDATKDIAGAFKLNAAFYEAHGDEGWAALRDAVSYIHEQAPALPVILDAKRADIGNTNLGYVDAAFEHLWADAITVHPYLGKEAMQPLLDRKDKGIIVLCRTSNEGAREFQDLDVGGKPLYQVVAEHVANEWNENGNCGLVVGATYPDELKQVRAVAKDLPILIPGIGAQNGDLAKSVAAGKDSRGRGMIISTSRAVIFASNGTDFADAARTKAQELHDAIAEAL